MKKTLHLLLALAAMVLAPAFAQKVLSPPPPLPPPVFTPGRILPDEKPVVIETQAEVTASNGFFQRVETTLTFTNPNGRVFEGELAFPIPDGAAVCGYALEVNGGMVPGVVCEKEQARVAFENEKRQGVDPGVVEHARGNIWKTRIYPLMPNLPRKAKIDYIAPIETGCVFEGEIDGDWIYQASPANAAPALSQLADRLRKATKARLYWDASFPRAGKTAADRSLLECLPEKGEWTLVVFRNDLEAPAFFTSRAELLKALDALTYDGAPHKEKVRRDIATSAIPPAQVFVFDAESNLASVAKRKVSITRIPKDNAKVLSYRPEPGKLLATAWAANRIADLSDAAGQHKAEILELGRQYGVASPVTSLIVLESLDQYLRYKIEPPKHLAFHGEWVKRRAAEDDPIAAEKAKAEHRSRLLALWEERVKWWNNPVPPKNTPSSGLFEAASASDGWTPRAILGTARNTSVRGSLLASGAGNSAERSAMDDEVQASCDVAAEAVKSGRDAPPSTGHGNAATIEMAEWDPKMPYLDALGKAAKGEAYGEYLRQREIHGKSPAFFLDCAGWFFKAGEGRLALRIISNLETIGLEDPGLWRTMGWRLREAEACDEAVDAFRHVLELRGEEPQSRRDLALVLAERGKARNSRSDLEEAAVLLRDAAFTPTARRSGRIGNDMQTCVLALEELNGLLAWAKARQDTLGGFTAPKLDAAFRREMPLDLRIVMSWDVDETDIDLHVLEPDGEEAFYGHRRTSTGGFVSEDVTTGYGPEEYLRKKTGKGTYKILANYYGSHQQKLMGAATVTATVYTGWATAGEKMRIISFRLDKPKDKHPIGEVKTGEQTDNISHERENP